MVPTLYAFAKSLHLIGMVSWMAGLFYLVRIMVYHAMASEKPDSERVALQRQYGIMEWKAYKIILRPAVVMTWSFGVLMLCIQPVWLGQGWMQVKLAFLLILTIYTHYLQGQIVALENGTSRYTHVQFRALNEVPTILMVGIIFLAVFKVGINFIALMTGLLGFTALIGWGVWRANRKQG